MQATTQRLEYEKAKKITVNVNRKEIKASTICLAVKNARQNVVNQSETTILTVNSL